MDGGGWINLPMKRPSHDAEILLFCLGWLFVAIIALADLFTVRFIEINGQTRAILEAA